MIASFMALLIALFAHGSHACPAPHDGSIVPAGSPAAPTDTGGGSPIVGT